MSSSPNRRGCFDVALGSVANTGYNSSGDGVVGKLHEICQPYSIELFLLISVPFLYELLRTAKVLQNSKSGCSLAVCSNSFDQKS